MGIALDNKCGTCTLCCKLPEVPEMKKPVNELCSLCEVEKGCKEYDYRPDSCKVFSCIWLSGGLSLDMRPDKCRVMLTLHLAICN